MEFRTAICFAALLTIVGCSNKDDLAKVGNTEISKAEFDSYLKFKRIDPSNQEYVDQALDQYIQSAAISQVVVSENLIDEKVIAIDVDNYRRQLLINRYLEEYLGSTVDDVAIKNFYQSNLDQFENTTAHVAHIIFRKNTSMSSAEVQVANQKAREALTQLAKGEEFGVLAKRISEDRYSAEKNGDLGWVSRESIDPSFSKAAFALESSETSGVIETQYGFHVIKLLDPVKTDTIPFEQVKGDIRYQLRLEAKANETARLLSLIKVSKYE